MPPVDPNTILNGINTAANLAGTAGSFMGGNKEGLSRQDQKYMAHMSQLYFENQLQYRARDAEKAGLHPLAAIGAMPNNPTLPGGSFGSEGPSLGERLQNMGQNVSRAIQAQQTLPQRALLNQQLENEKAQGDFIRAQTAESIARAKNLSQPPAFPQGSQSPSDRFGFSHTGSAMGIGPRHVLIQNPDGSTNVEDSPQYGSTLYHRPISSSGRDLLQIMKDALKSTGNLYRNLYWHKRPKNWKSEI